MVRFFISSPLNSPYGEAFSTVKGEILGRLAFSSRTKGYRLFTPPSTGQPKAGKGEGEELQFGKESR